MTEQSITMAMSKEAQEEVFNKNIKMNYRTISLDFASKATPVSADALIKEAQVIYDWLIKEL